MRKEIYPLVLVSSMALTSCSKIMHNLPGVYSIDIQQGNIVDQEMIDQLRPKMTKRQVLYIMGSSMLVDVFHQKRWDYLYSVQPDGEPRRQKRLSLFFDGDELIGVQGDFRPSTLPVIKKSNVTTVEVPERDLDKTLWGKFISLFSDDDPKKLQQETIDEKPADSQSEPDETIKTIEAVKEVDENGGVSITKLKDDVPQELEEITVDKKPTTTQSESSTETTETSEINNGVSENDETSKVPMTDNNQEELTEVINNERPIETQSEPDKEITEVADEVIENEKNPPEEDMLQKMEEIQN